jgi:hypothetical protein
MFGNAGTRFDFARPACRELRAVLARDDESRRRGRLELLGIDVPAACDAVNVLRLVLVRAGGLRFTFALGESLLPLSHAVGREAFHDYCF